MQTVPLTMRLTLKTESSTPSTNESSDDERISVSDSDGLLGAELPKPPKMRKMNMKGAGKGKGKGKKVAKPTPAEKDNSEEDTQDLEERAKDLETSSSDESNSDNNLDRSGEPAKKKKIIKKGEAVLCRICLFSQIVR